MIIVILFSKVSKAPHGIVGGGFQGEKKKKDLSI